MSDVRTLLLTDVVDSTKLAEAIGDAAMAEVWISHDRAARDLLVKHRGREIDKTDGMLMLFDEAADAVSYALAYHHALAELPIALEGAGRPPRRPRDAAQEHRRGRRAGGQADRGRGTREAHDGADHVAGAGRPDADHRRGARRRSARRTCASSRTASGWSRASPSRSNCSRWATNSSPFVPPPDSEKVYRVIRDNDWWLPVKEIPHNLPHLATAFVGREREIGEVRAALEKARLVTLLGMGGLGKTRLAVQSAVGLLHKLFGRRLVPRPVPAARRSARRERSRAVDRREGGARPPAAAVDLRAPEGQARAADHRQLRAPDEAVGRTRQRGAARRTERAHHRHEPRGAACSGRAELPGAAAAVAGARRERRRGRAVDGRATVRRARAAEQAVVRAGCDAQPPPSRNWWRGSKASRWRSNWPPRACARCRWRTSTRG